MSGNVAYIHDLEAGPAFTGAPLRSQHLCIAPEAGRHYVKIEAGPDWTSFPESRVELGGGDVGSKFHLVKWGQP